MAVRHFRVLACLALAWALPAAAQNVSLVGVIGNKAAILAIDSGAPKTVKVGQTWNGVSVIAVEKEQATIEIDGKRKLLARGQFFGAASGERPAVAIPADERGHFFVDGAVNGVPVRFIVDTGATSVTLPAAEAKRMGIDYRKGRRGTSQTASGTVTAWRVQLDSVRAGGIELASVEGVVIEQGLDVALLGASFLNRTEMKREGQTMILIKRF